MMLFLAVMVTSSADILFKTFSQTPWLTSVLVGSKSESFDYNHLEKSVIIFAFFPVDTQQFESKH